MRYNVGIIGCGNIAAENNSSFTKWPVTHIAAYKDCSDIEVVAVADTIFEKAKDCAVRWNVPYYYSSHEQMLREREVEIISICTPYETHARIIRDILQFSKKTKVIFCEKPLASNLGEARELTRLCKENGVILAVNFQRRHDAFYRYVKENITTLVGEVKTFIFTYAGGVVNTGSHAFDLLRYYFGDVEELKAEYADSSEKENHRLKNIDPSLHVFVTLKSGVRGVLTSYHIPEHSSFELTIIGTKAKISLMNKPFFDYDYLYLAYKNSEFMPAVTCLSSEQSWPIPKNLERDLFLCAVRDIVAAIDSGKKVESSAENGLASLELASAAIISASADVAVKLPLPLNSSIELPKLRGLFKQWEKKLALFGGEKTFFQDLPITNTIGAEEKEAVMKVMERGVLSGFVAKWDERFYGGEEVVNFEKNFSKKFGVKHAVSFNSATTALHGAIAAIGIGPGDEVITSPYTMTATPTSILLNQGIPVFADIDPESCCLDYKDVERKITPRTKAILSVNLFGNTPRYDKLLEIARKHNLLVIEDCAQAPGGVYQGKFAGTIGDIGVFSYNFHKTIQCGEGGVLVTNNDRYALRAQLLRNHGEVVLDEMADDDPRKKEFILGSNYRLSELHAVIANEQLKKLDFLTEKRIALADYLTMKIKEIPGLTPHPVEEGNKHVYYLYPIRFNAKIWGISRDDFIKAMKAEGAPLSGGYVKPLYLIPLYQKLMAYTKTNYPFDSKHYSGKVNYVKGICPVTERMYEEELVLTNICRYPLTFEHIDLFVSAIKKVYINRDRLRSS